MSERKIKRPVILPSPVPSGSTTVRIKREGGVVVSDCDIYIGRACYQGGWELGGSIWHNPFKLSDYDNNRQVVLSKYREYVLSRKDLMDNLPSLAGKRLGCWCHNGPNRNFLGTIEPFCHGDVLIDLLERLNCHS
jgi:hypothetical protein